MSYWHEAAAFNEKIAVGAVSPCWANSRGGSVDAQELPGPATFMELLPRCRRGPFDPKPSQAVGGIIPRPN